MASLRKFITRGKHLPQHGGGGILCEVFPPDAWDGDGVAGLFDDVPYFVTLWFGGEKVSDKVIHDILNPEDFLFAIAAWRLYQILSKQEG
ncbi:MAG: hypothetical protein Q4D98_06565 [Planctomycetia bacterium]|nr:hypothetical protein [Planctomycetia bacterium]